MHEPGSRAELLNLREAADRLGVHYMTAYRYVRTGRLPAIQIGSHWFVPPRDLHRVGARATPAGRPGGHAPVGGQAAARRLEDRLVAGDEAVRGRLSKVGWARDPTPTRSCWTNLVWPCTRWGSGGRTGEYTVDDEHRASGVASRVVARLGARFTKRGPRRRSVILGTPPREMHGLPTAMAANVLRGHGYDVIDLGADVPPDTFAAAVTKTARPLAVAVAVTAGNHDRSVRAIVRAIEQADPHLPVLVGGAGIIDDAHATQLGATWSGGDARRLRNVIDDLDHRSH